MRLNRWRQRQFVKRLLALSLDEKGDVEAQRVEAVLDSIKTLPYSDHKGILKQYFWQIRDVLRREEARISYSGSIRPDQMSSLAAFFSKRYNRGIRIVAKEKPDLIAGFRIRVGDDIYDYSVKGRLKILRNYHYYYQ